MVGTRGCFGPVRHEKKLPSMARAGSVQGKLYILFTTCLFFVILNFTVNLPPRKYTPSNLNSMDAESDRVLFNRLQKCKSMFSLLEPYEKQRIPRHFLEDPSWYLTTESFDKAALQMTKMLAMRAKGLGPATQDYRELARVVPNLLYFVGQQSPVINTSSESNSKSLEKTQSMLITAAANLSLNVNKHDDIRAHNNIQNDLMPSDHYKLFPEGKVVPYMQSSHGIFPFIPCKIKLHDQENVDSCLNIKLQKDDMTISFLGDSKVRNIFTTFLNMTSYLNYNITYANKTVPLEVLNRESSNDNFKHEDFSAISSTYPNFRIVSRFRRFWDIANLHTSDEVLLLQEWASGRRPVPDLLIVGYTSWMLYLHAERIDYKTHIHLDVLHLLFELHQVIVPLLKEVSLRTKVLVHADTRLRPFSKSSKTYDLFKKNILFHNSLIDWSEMIFWHFLKSSQDYQKQMDNQSAFISHSSRVLKEFYERTKSQFKSANHEDDTTVSNDSFVNIRMDFDGIPHRADPKDHLRHFGLWWWDTTLVLNLATISECGKLYKLNLQNHPLYNSQQLRCRDHHHAGNSTNEVEVLMILNLLCNSVVHTTEAYCCS